MADFKIDLTGEQIPVRDGEINTYVSKEAAGQPEYFAPNRRVVFINGMKNSGEDHATSALVLSLVQMCPVIGVYNRSAGLVMDLAQCLADKNQFNGPLSLSASHKAAFGTLTGRTAEKTILDALARNPVQVELFKLLRAKETKPYEIFAHSQGNLILSNALQGLLAVDGPAAIVGRIVHTFGSPTVNWPPGIDRRDHGYTFDMVNWLSGFDSSFSISKVGMPSGSLNPFTHGFLEYLQKDPAFVVNRFRVGGWGMTFNMDEDGLANCLFAMGTNMPRVGKIFKHLDDHHRSDADDVAVRYVARVKGSPGLGAALRADRSLVQLLIKVMDEGWTSSEEKAAIAWLRGL